MRQGQEETARMVRESQMESAQTIRKGKKPAYTFRKKGNEIQSAFIDQVVEQVASAASCIGRVEIAEERGLKMIKFADGSEAGWAVVEEYKEDALASNSEDEKRMEKVVREADRKVAELMALPDPIAQEAQALRECPKALASVPYPLISVNEHGADESTCCGCSEVGNVSPNGGETVGEVTPSFGTCGDVERCGRCWEVQDGDTGTVSRTALIEREFVDKAVYEFLKGGYIERAESPPVVCSPLSVVTNGVGKKRLVVNLRHVNGFLWKQKFKYEDLRVAMMLFEQGKWLCSFDLKSGYHHVDVAKHHHKYLGFKWGRSVYTVVVLSFGLSSAPYVFTKMMRRLVRLWRSKGLKAIVHLDDGFVASQYESSANAASTWVRDTLRRVGWVCNEEKFGCQPTGSAGLGNLDLEKGSISVPEGKVRALQHRLKVAAKKSSLVARDIASLIGRIVSMGLALGPVARFMTQALYALLETRLAWCDMLPITQEACEEITFWTELFDQFNAQPIWHSPAEPLLGNLEDPELMRLAQTLPATVLRSRADSTTKKYLGAFQRWKIWADARQGVPSFPVPELHLVLYMQHLSESTGVEDRLFKQHGRWKSESAKDGYVKDSLSAVWRCLNRKLSICALTKTADHEMKEPKLTWTEVFSMWGDMAAPSTLGTIGPYDRGSEEWSAYCEWVLIYLSANAVEDADRQHAVFLSVCGAQTYQLNRSVVVPAKPSDKTLKELMDLVKEHLQPAPSVIMQRFNFNGRMQKGEEAVAEYVAELRRIAEHCEFKDTLDEMLRDRLVCGIKDTRVRRRLLAEPKLTFTKALEIAQAAELAEKGARMLQPHLVTELASINKIVQPASRPFNRCRGKAL
ncbi:hypothetical protein EMCRGX_G007980 [Ephydatia muelleri]